MAELIGVTASIIGVIELAKGVTTAIYKYAKAYKNAPAELKSLRLELTTLIGVLDLLKDAEEDPLTDDETKGTSMPPGGDSALGLDAVGGPLWLCQEVLQGIMSKLGKPGEKMDRLKQALWPFKESEIKEQLSKLERAKSVLELALVADHGAAMRELQRMCQALQTSATGTAESVKQVHQEQISINEKITSRHSSEDQEKALRWLHNNIDYESNHRAARNLHQDGTGKWFTDGPHFTKWLNGNHARDEHLIWLHGIPGAGKTVLLSTIVEKTLESLKSRTNVGVAYFYFTFREVEKQRTASALRSILGQLVTQVPSGYSDGVLALFKKYQLTPGHPENSEIIGEITNICEKLGSAYVMLDALDECADSEKDSLFDVIGELTKSSAPQMRMIVTSRKEWDIQRSLDEFNFNTISIQSSEVDRDIHLFVDKLLKDDRDLRRYKSTVKTTILEKLTTGAQGMFRWVECQIGPLKRCRNAAQVLTRLSNLPEDLYETYYSILKSTPGEDREFLRRALAWIMWSKRPLSLYELSEAMIVEPGSDRLDENARFGELPSEADGDFTVFTPDPHEFLSAILSICGSLVRVEPWFEEILRLSPRGLGPGIPGPCISLSHYSVYEYLTSADIATGDCKVFALSEREGSELLLDSCLTYLQFEQFSDCGRGSTTITHEDRVNRGIGRHHYPLYNYAAEFWYDHITSKEQELSILSRGNKLLQVDSGHFKLWRFRFDCSSWSNPNVEGLEDKQAGDPLYFMARFGLVDLVREMLRGGLFTPLLDSIGPPALYAAVGRNHLDVVRVLAEEGGVDVNWIGPGGNTAINIAASEQCLEVLRFLLDKGADLNQLNDNEESPLHCSVRQMSAFVMKALNPQDNYETPRRRGPGVTYHEDGIVALQALIDAGADPKSPFNVPILDVPAVEGKPSQVKVLLDSGVAVNIPCKEGKTALLRVLEKINKFSRRHHPDENIYIIKNAPALLSVCELLLARGGNLGPGKPNLTELEFNLIAAQASMEATCGVDYTEKVLAILDSGADFNQPIVTLDNRETALTYAIRHCLLPIAKRMDLLGANMATADMRLGNWWPDFSVPWTPVDYIFLYGRNPDFTHFLVEELGLKPNRDVLASEAERSIKALAGPSLRYDSEVFKRHLEYIPHEILHHTGWNSETVLNGLLYSLSHEKSLEIRRAHIEMIRALLEKCTPGDELERDLKNAIENQRDKTNIAEMLPPVLQELGLTINPKVLETEHQYIGLLV